MRHFNSLILLIVITGSIFSCQEKDIKKPDKLISKQKMVEMLADVHLAKSLFQQQYEIPDSLRLSSVDLYYSVLDKYEVPDSVFLRSLVYYSSIPKEYEKMYLDVINVLKEMEKDPSEQEELNLGNKPVKPDSTKVK